MAIRKNSSRDVHRVRAFLPDSVRLWVMNVQVITSTMTMMRAGSVPRASVPACRVRLRSIRAIVLVSRGEATRSVRAISPASREAIVHAIIRMAISSRAVTSIVRPTIRRRAVTVVPSSGVAINSVRTATVVSNSRVAISSVRAATAVSSRAAISSVRAVMVVSSRVAISSVRAVTVVSSKAAINSVRAATVSAQPTTIPMQSTA